MRELMLEIALQFRIHCSYPAYGDTKLAIVKRSCPGRRLGDVHEFFLRVQNDDDVLARLIAQLAGQILVSSFQARQNLLLQLWGCLFALVMKREVPAFFAARPLLDL